MNGIKTNFYDFTKEDFALGNYNGFKLEEKIPVAV